VARREVQVAAAEAGLRLDRFVSQSHPGVSRRALTLLFADGRVLKNGRPAKKGERVEVGDRVAFDPEEAEVVARPSAGEGLRLMLVTNDFVIVDKPAGLPSAAVPGRLEGTVAGQLVSLFPELADVGYGKREPGLVHRLDTQTSGLLLAARSNEAFTLLREQMRAGSILKRYLAMVSGTAPSAGRIDVGLEPDPHDARRVRPTTATGTRVTAFRLLESKAGHSLLEVTLARGYRHQIRAHLASLGLPLVGDLLYGGPASGLSPRHALHASYIAAESGELRFRVESELPADLAAFWSRLADGD